MPSKRHGRKAHAASAMSSARAASRCCSSITPLIEALHRLGFEVGVETNGTQDAPEGLDWICVSPKADAALKLTRGDELKLVYPQKDVPPERFADLDFTHFFLQPLDDANRDANTKAATEYCLAHPHWRLSLQTHKLIGIP